MFRAGDWVRFKTIDELIGTYRDKRTIEAIHRRSPFEDFGITFVPGMYRFCGTPVKIVGTYGDKSMLVNGSGYRYRVIPEWLVAEGENADFSINKKEDLLDVFYFDEDISKINDTRVRLLKSVERGGGGIDGGSDGEEVKRIKGLNGLISFVNCECKNISRNNGLIAFTEVGMANMQSYSEGDLDLILADDVDDIKVINYIYSYYDDFDEAKEEYEDLAEEDIPEILFDLDHEFCYDELDEIFDFLYDNGGNYLFKGKDGYFGIIG